MMQVAGMTASNGQDEEWANSLANDRTSVIELYSCLTDAVERRLR